MNGYLFLYNIKGLKNYDKSIIDGSVKIDFYQVMKEHFVEIKEMGNHKNIIRDKYKIYFWWDKEPENYLEVQFSGKASIEKLIKLGQIQNWSVMFPLKEKLVNLELIKKRDLEDFFLNQQKEK